MQLGKAEFLVRKADLQQAFTERVQKEFAGLDNVEIIVRDAGE